jgi:biotin transport system substrate-specific component
VALKIRFYCYPSCSFLHLRLLLAGRQRLFASLVRDAKRNWHIPVLEISMSAAQSTTSTLAGALWPAKANPILRNILLVVAGVALLTLSAKVQVPFWPVPVTLQTLAVPLIAAAFGARLGTATVLAYLATGLVLPVFASAGFGPAYFAGPTAGYLVAYPIAAWIVGSVAERVGNRVLPLFATMLAADVLVLALGFGWLAYFIQSIEKAWLGGVAPFLFADLVKVGLAAALIGLSWTGLKKLRG